MRTAILVLALGCAAAGPPGAASCTGCHVPGGGLAPLQGRSAADIGAALDGFRDGSRPGTLMPRIVRGFSPAELHALATWFAAP